MQTQNFKINASLDTRAMVCPMPGLRTMKLLRGLKSGEIAKVIGRHQILKKFIPVITRVSGNNLMTVESDTNGDSNYYFKKS